jgi:hypothetical protein
MSLVPERMILPERVLAASNWFEMGRVAAGAIAAQVIELQSLRDLLVIVVLPHEAVRHALWMPWSPAVLAVSVRGLRPGPVPAEGLRVPDYLPVDPR